MGISSPRRFLKRAIFRYLNVFKHNSIKQVTLFRRLRCHNTVLFIEASGSHFIWPVSILCGSILLSPLYGRSMLGNHLYNFLITCDQLLISRQNYTLTLSVVIWPDWRALCSFARTLQCLRRVRVKCWEVTLPESLNRGDPEHVSPATNEREWGGRVDPSSTFFLCSLFLSISFFGSTCLLFRGSQLWAEPGIFSAEAAVSFPGGSTVMAVVGSNPS